jgi:hypothetical protein
VVSSTQLTGLVVGGEPSPGSLNYASARARNITMRDAKIGTGAYINSLHDSMTNRDRYLQLLALSKITQVESANLIAAQIQRPCAPRTVRAWLATPGSASARPCPDWAVEALERRLKALKKPIA